LLWLRPAVTQHWHLTNSYTNDPADKFILAMSNRCLKVQLGM